MAIAVASSLCAGSVCAQVAEPVATVRVDATPGHAINSFDPDSALGSSIDVLSRTGIDKVYSPHIVQESLSAGWGPISYRNNTELRMAAWHWTENGTWSDHAHQSGYFTASTELKEPTRYILSYALPHRGFSTSGDRPIQGPTLTYWKSNPYLTSKFTGESDALHPQWVVVDLKSERAVDEIRIAWASPYATSYRVEYWIGKDALDFDRGPQGEWKTFPSGTLTSASGGAVPYTFTTATPLPNGLTFSSSGLLSGTPQQTGNISFVVQVTDSANQIATRTLTLDKSEPGVWKAVTQANELGLWRATDGKLNAMVNVGPANPREYAEVTSTTNVLAPLTNATGGEARRLADASGNVTIPRMLAVRSSDTFKGDDWLGLKMRDASVVRGIGVLPLFAGMLGLLLLIGSLAATWAREGR